MSTFYPKSGGYLNIKCTDWSDKMLSVNGWFDSLTVSVGSDKFKDLSLVDRHRKIYSIFKDEIAGEIHAMQIQTHTYEEWRNKK